MGISHHLVGIVMINWNSYEVTRDTLMCLTSLKKNYQVVLVDNGSTDNSKELLKAEFPTVTLIESGQNLGFAGGNNLGINYCLDQNLEYIMLLNNDVLFEKDFIEPMVQYLINHPEAGAIQPKIFYNHDRETIWNAGGKFIQYIGLSQTIGVGKRDHKRFNQLKSIDWITGCCYCARASVIKEVGLLDESFFIYHEDVDWSLRMRKAGHQLVYYPDSFFYHIAGVSQKSTQKHKEGFVSENTHYLNLRNQIWVMRRYMSWYYVPTAALFMGAKLTAYFLYFILRNRPKKLKAVFRGTLDGLRVNTTI